MRKLVFCALLLTPASILAQSSPRMVSEVHLSTPKPGMTAQFESGRKQPSAFHAAQKDTWNVYIWQIMTGEHSGSYMSSSPGHHCSDFDARQPFNKIDAPDITKNITPYLASTTLNYYVLCAVLQSPNPPPPPA